MSAMIHAFDAPNGTVFHPDAGHSGGVHTAPAAVEPPVEVPLHDMPVLVAHGAVERDSKLGRG